jgi:superfamily I DNA/RNA helicase
LKAKKKKGLIVEALAGAGKSTILWMIAQELMQQGILASEVVAVVFGKKNQTDLQNKFKTKVGSEWGESVRTIHSLCYEIYRSALGVKHQLVKMERGKYREIAQKFGLLPIESESRSTPGSLLEDELIFAEKDFLDLLDKLRLYCLDATPDNVGFLTNLYKLGIKDPITVGAAAASCLGLGLKEATGSQFWIDTTDMVWVPWVLREDARFAGAIARRRDNLRVLMCDEIQDTDLLQVEIFSLLIDPEHSFLIGVGDSKQAVYFFRGCLNDGMQRITERFSGENLPLPVCYRCGVKHLELVREVFSDTPIQPRPNAPQGEVKVIWEKDFLSIFDNSALSYMGVCRKNAPLTIAAIRLLAAGKPAKIKDKNIGGRLVSRVREICQRQRYKPDTFPRVLREYETTQKRKLEKFPDGEAKISDLDDTLQAIWALFEHYEPKTLLAWEEIVNRIFDESGYSPISLYSIHSGKGGEGQVSFILCPDELPLEHPKQVQQEREQEDHLLYVALTRTLADGVEAGGILYLIIRPDQRDGKPKYPTWLPTKYRNLIGEDTKPSNTDPVWEVEDEPLQSQDDSLQVQTDQECEDCNDGFYIATPEGSTCNACGCMSLFPALNTDPQFACKTCGYIHLSRSEDGSTCPQCQSRDIKSDPEWHGEEMEVAYPEPELETVNGLQSEVAPSETLEKPTGIRWISPAEITLDAGTQSRAGMNEAAIQEYAQQMNDGLWQWEREPLPVLFWDGARLYPGDGHHRITAAAIAIGSPDIYCEVLEGTARDARFFSCGANRFHGLQRTNADKRNQVSLLLLDEEWQQMSDRAIADHCNVSAPFVGKVRAELAEVGTVNLSTERVDRKGRKIDTSNIGTKPKSATPPAALESAIAPQPKTTAAEPRAKASTVGVLESAFAEDQKREQARTNRATQIRAKIANLRTLLASLEAELSALEHQSNTE